MKLKSIFLMAGAAIAGIYLTSEEGKKARLALQKKKSAIEPIVKDLISQANDVLDGTKQLDSDALKLNINKLVNEAKSILINLDLDKAVQTSKDAIKVATRKINQASNDLTKTKIKKNIKRKVEPKISSKSRVTKNK